MSLKLIVATRHGEDWGNQLTDTGVEKVTRLADRISSLLNGSSILLLSSPTTRAILSAEILAKKLGVEPFIMEELSSKYGDQYECGQHQMEKSLPALDGKEVVIFVSHFESPAGIIDAFSKKFCGKGTGCIRLHYGEGLALDISSGVVTKIS